VEGESVHGMHDHWSIYEAGCQPSHKSAFGCVGMHNVVVLTSQEVAEANQTGQIPKRSYVAPDNIQVCQAQTMLPYGSLENRICGEYVNLPSLSLGDLAQPEDNAASPTEAGIADNMEELDRAPFSMGKHGCLYGRT
jgi:hypothetical protein